MSRIAETEDRWADFAWAAEDDCGAAVGQEGNATFAKLEAKLAKARAERDRDGVEYYAVEIAAKRFASERDDVSLHANGGWVCDYAATRKAFGTCIRAAAKRAHDDTPWPEWALKAQEEGWKAPKGWKP